MRMTGFCRLEHVRADARRDREQRVSAEAEHPGIPNVVARCDVRLGGLQVRFLDERFTFAVSQGIPEELICLDPGIGFGKTVEHNFELLRRLDELAALGRPILVGISRKSSLGRIMGDPDAKTGTTAASVGAAVLAYERGASIFRVHDVREHVEALAAAQAALA